MNAIPDLATMHLLLRQGRAPAVFSLGLLLVALLLLGLQLELAMLAAGLLLLSVGAGLVQAWYALRVGLDAALLDLLRHEALQGEAAALRVDQTLHAAGLRAHDPDAPARGWDLRWRGMRTLLLRQYLLAALQLVSLLFAVLWPVG